MSRHRVLEAELASVTCEVSGGHSVMRALPKGIDVHGNQNFPCSPLCQDSFRLLKTKARRGERNKELWGELATL